MPDISVVIVSWNSKDIVRRCVESVVNHQSKYSFDVILIDNASTDGTPDMVEQEFPSVRIFRNDSNQGFSKAYNAGIRKATGRYVCVLNSDIILRENCFDLLMDYIEQHSKVGIVSPKLLYPDLRLQGSCQSFPTLWNNFCEATGLNKLFPKRFFFQARHLSTPLRIKENAYTHPVEVIPAAFWLVRSEAFQEVGLFDEDFFIYCEDMDLCKRFWDRGWEVILYPEAEAIHHHGGSSSNLPNRFYFEQQRTGLQYWRKHHGILGVLSITLIKILHHLIRIFVSALSWPLRPKKRPAAWESFQRSLLAILFYLRLYRP